MKSATAFMMAILLTVLLGCSPEIPLEIAESTSGALSLPDDGIQWEMEGEYTLLGSPYNVGMMRYSDYVECGGLLVCRWQAAGTRTGNGIHIYDLATGVLISQAEADETFALQPALDQPGYDYRMVYADSVVYRNSQDSNLNLAIVLPESFSPESNVHWPNFDLYGDQLIWCGEEGVWWTTLDGGEPQLLLPVSRLPQEYTSYRSDPFVYCRPRWLNAASQLAVLVYQNIAEDACVAVELYGMVDQSITVFDHYNRSVGASYPLVDRYIVLGGTDIRILDAVTGEIREIWIREMMPEDSGHGEYLTYDTQTFLMEVEFDGLSLPERIAYTWEWDQTEHPFDPILLSITFDQSAMIYEVTENYGIWVFRQNDQAQLAVAEYREAGYQK